MADNAVKSNILNLTFEDGFKEVMINNDPERKIRWNPNDVNFVDRFLTFQEWVDADFKKRLDALGVTKEKKFEDYDKGTITALGNDLNEAIDATFGRNVSGPAFMGVNPISPMKNGSLLFINFIDALMPVIEKSIKDFDAARKKYTDAAKRKGQGPVHPALKKS